MRLFGFEIVFRKALPTQNLQTVSSSTWLNSWWGGPIRESFAGAWQKNVTLDPQTSILAFSAVFACVTGIASDVAKMRIKLDRDIDGIWTEIQTSSPFLPVLRKPNHYQTRIKFIEQWIISKLLYGNAYVLKERDNRGGENEGIVTRLYVLDPRRVTPLVADDGSVFYRLKRDLLSQVTDDEDAVVPASEIIHDMMVSLWHPLIGVSPIYACAASTTMGNKIQANSTNLFGNQSRPGGVVMFPTTIDDTQAQKFKERWEQNFGGTNLGRTAILDNGSKFEAFTMPAADAQLIEQLRWTVEDVARAFHYPPYKLAGPLPAYASSPQALTMMYYTDCLQTLIESLELCLDEGLELPPGMGTELDLDNLMRMDTQGLFDSNAKGVGGGWLSPNEARFKANYSAVEGGDSPYLQQQNFSLQALAKRDAQPDPFKSNATTPPGPNPPADAVTPVKESLIPAMKAEEIMEYSREDLADELEVVNA